MYMVVGGGRRGYRQLVDGFWDDALRQGIALPTCRPVSAPAFCNARRKLSSVAIRDLVAQTSREFDHNFGKWHRIKGRRILAADSSKIALQRAGELFDHFGAPKNGLTPQATVNLLFDVVAKMPIDATVQTYANDERGELYELLKHLKRGDVLLLDRGYPSYELIQELRKRGIDFVIRMVTTTGFPAAREFLESGAKDRRVRFEKPKQASRAFEPCDLRMVRNTTPSGEVQVYVTSLARKEFSSKAILDLYRRRWEVELAFREQKGEAIGKRQLHSRSVDGVRQEIYATYLYLAITRSIMAASIGSRDLGDRYIPQRNAIFKLAQVFTELLLSKRPKRANETLNRLLTELRRGLEKRRRSRSFPRRSLRPAPRWGVKGRH